MNADTPRFDTREQWLAEAVRLADPIFHNVGLALPADKIRVSCSWPGGGSRTKRVGEAWSAEASEDGHLETFISPVLSDSREVLAILIHELVHHAVGLECGHRGPFRKALPLVGISGGKPTATEPDANFDDIWTSVRGHLGRYPHGALAPVRRKVQTTRMVKLACPSCCYTVRTSQKWIDVGMPTCPCGTEMVVD